MKITLLIMRSKKKIKALGQTLSFPPAALEDQSVYDSSPGSML